MPVNNMLRTNAVLGETIKRLNLNPLDYSILLSLLGIKNSGEIEDEGPWAVAEEAELIAVLTAFIYCQGKNNWHSAKSLALELFFPLEEEFKLEVNNDEPVEELNVYTDGASRGNPGDAGIGVAVYDDRGNLLKEKSSYLGKTTNNIAEYTALLEGIKIALTLKTKKVKFYLDSELVVKQIKGLYKVKNEGLQLLYNQVIDQIKLFEQFSIEHIPREQNKKADQLANQGIDCALRK